MYILILEIDEKYIINNFEFEIFQEDRSFYRFI